MDDTNLQMLEEHILVDPKNSFWAFVNKIKVYDDLDLECWLEEIHVPICEN